MAAFERITIHNDLPQGYPTLRDTKVSVFEIGRRGAAGESLETLLAEYPTLTAADIEEALDFCQHDMQWMIGEAVFDSKRPASLMLGYASLLEDDVLDSGEIKQFAQEIPPYVRSIDEVWSGLSVLLQMKYRESPQANERRPARAVIEQAISMCHGQVTMGIRAALADHLPDIVAGDGVVQALYGLISSRADGCLEAAAVVEATMKDGCVEILVHRPHSERFRDTHFNYMLGRYMGRLAAAAYALHVMEMPLVVDVGEEAVVFRVDVPVWQGN